MILADRRKPERFPHLLLAGLLLLAAAFAVPGLFRTAKTVLAHPPGGAPGLIVCDAEYRRGDSFTNGSFEFGNGNTQSDARAHTGTYSSRLLPAGQMQFGMGIRLHDLQPGGLYQASVWRFQHQSGGRGYLAVRSEGGQAPMYRTQDHPHRKMQSGWEQVQMQFFVPFSPQPDFIEVYTFSNGKDTVYFDDFEIRLLRTFRQSDFEIPAIDIRLGKDAMQRLREKRTQALQSGLLETGPGDWVKGKIQWDGLETPVNARFRLKGDWLDHLNTEKWSFRIELAGSYFWRGMQTFSIQHPGTRYYLHEWLLHRLWQQEDVLTTRYDFAKVRLNGQPMGLYAVEEHFEKYLVERQNRREGPVLKLDETGFWDGLAHQLAIAGEVFPDLFLNTSQPQKAPVEAFSPKRLEANPDLQAMSRHAASLVDQFRTGRRTASQLFDLDKTARFYAIADVLNAHHAMAWHNLRFYYNPVADRLEPVGFDGFGTGPSERNAFLLQGFAGIRPDQWPELHDLLMLDTAFISRYARYLQRYSETQFLTAFFRSTDSLRLPLEMALLQEFPEYGLREDDWIRAARTKRIPFLPQADHSFACRQSVAKEGARIWALNNRHLFPLILLGYASGPEGAWTPLEAPVWFASAPDRPLWMETLADSFGIWPAIDQLRSKAGALQASRPWPEAHSMPLPADAAYLIYQLPGLDSLFRQRLHAGLPFQEPTPRQELLDRPMPPSNGRWEMRDGYFRFMPGNHTFSEWLVIPEGYQVEAGPGTRLDFVQGAGLLSLSPVRFSGLPDAPVLITSSDGTGKGFAVLAPATNSSLEQVIFEKLTAFQWKSWQLTGAVTFQGGSVKLSNCIFRHTRSEDALNLVQCEVDMERCLFLDTPSDGFDCDFCLGQIRQSAFRDCGNDGLDFSGSRVTVSESQFERCGDKGISVGEQSDAALWDNEIQEATTGIAVKDQSTAVADNLKLTRCTTGMAVYQKKPELGPARLVVRSHQAESLTRLYRIQQGSSLQLGDELIKGRDQDLFE